MDGREIEIGGGDGAIRILASPTEVWDLTPRGDTHKRNVSTRVMRLSG